MDVVNSTHPVHVMASLPAYDMCILDLDVDGCPFKHTIEALRQKWPHCRILIYTMREEPWMMDELMELGVEGMVSNNSAIGQLTVAIESLRRHENYYDGIFSRLISHISNNKVTKRENQVLRQIA